METIVFAGVGAMAEAIIQGFVKEGVVPPRNMYVMNKSDKEKLQKIAHKYGVQIVCEDRAILAKADLLILAMKPKDIQGAMENLFPYLGVNTTVLSVAAGVSMQSIEEKLGKRPIVRVMPNTSASIGMSASGIAFNHLVTDSQKDVFIGMLEAIGLVIEVEEDELHAVTALSGSGPAYLYYLVEAFEQAGMKFGLSQKTVRNLAVQTIAGAAEMLKQTNEEPSELRRKVTSPGGTTEAGIKALEEHDFKEIIMACVQNAEAKSRELSALLDK
ncbi:pyrroline-5-carboxylate reductase [Rummeliibacillus stabekisii]|uniref:Pyrroline-5-carboxylate reductase n=1 Tax=Rummeliibacillus stabekisii TaxID=241244 RepID=A0A143HB55_9BACL|nr:pyrroline-5-carboxylate reductase [Rummeliibacillus stabekisii]AMW98942.1 pyrroline-5-carboxylate reductase [Rummeliibacillus stabekisii]